MAYNIYANLFSIISFNGLDKKIDKRVHVEKQLASEGYTEIRWKHKQIVTDDETFYLIVLAKKDGKQHYFVFDEKFKYNYYVVVE